ncbi:MAG: DNA polymerase Y family protein [Rhodanobacteraceae bacterium]|nr:MAG: DNA polymerase Y family protein [Rhodanobacteraceae bacterium]
MAWACVLLPSLALDGALRNRPPLDTPFALVSGPVQQRRLVAVNAAARAAGLHPGQRLATAQAICRDLATAGHDPHQLAANLALIAAWAYRFSAEVALAPPRAIVLEAGKSLGLFGPWPRFAGRLRQELAGLGFRHQIALAPNPCAAKVLAGVHDGACVPGASALERALADIPITRAGLPPAAADALPGMGVRTLGQLLALPRAALQRRFGAALITTLEQLLGQQPAPFTPYRPPDHFVGRIEWPFGVTNHTTLLFPLRRLLGDLAACVAARDSGVQQFSVRFEHEHAAPTDLTIGLLAPQREAAALFDIAKLRLERTALPHPVIALGVRAATLPPFVPTGHDLFDTRPANAIPWEQLRERLRARLGEHAVHRLAADPDPRPERASAYDTPASPGDPPPLPPRPTWLLERPIPLRGPTPHILAGPERLETGWWDGGDIRRDYYIVEIGNGQRAWAFCPPGERTGWMLHGWFA